MLPAIHQTQVLDAHGRPFYIMATGPRGEIARGFGSEMPYKGASLFRRADTFSTVWDGSADTDFMWSQNVMRARSRQLVRNNPLATGALQTVLDNVIGPGLRVHPEMDRDVLGISDDEAENLERQFVRVFNEWAESVECDLQRVQDFYQLQRLAFNSVNESGDILALAPTIRRAGATLSTRVQLVEADRLSNPYWGPPSPTLIGGVELDEATGAPLAYHVQKGHPGGLYERTATQMTWQRIDAFGKTTGRRNCWLMFRRKRPAQHRGIPYFFSALEQLKQIERYTDQELQASIVGGSFTVFVTSPAGEGLMPLASVPFGQEMTPAATNTDVALDYGAIVDLLPGEDIKIANPGRPNQNFDNFVNAVVQQIGAGIGVPFELLNKHFRASYSASRASLLEAWKFFRPERVWFASSFCTPFYELVITEAVARGVLSAPGFLDNPSMRRAYLRAAWIGPVPGQLNPIDEVKAAAQRIEIGVSSIAREALELSGADWESIHLQRKKEVAMRRADGLEPIPAAPLPVPGTLAATPVPAEEKPTRNQDTLEPTEPGEESDELTVTEE